MGTRGYGPGRDIELLPQALKLPLPPGPLTGTLLRFSAAEAEQEQKVVSWEVCGKDGSSGRASYVAFALLLRLGRCMS